MTIDVLNDKSFLLYAAKHYENPACHSTEEFMDDMRRIKYVQKLITRYVETGDLKERLILNHIVVLGNVFRPEALCRILYLKMENQFQYIKPFLLGLNILVDNIYNVGKVRTVDTNLIPMDQKIVEALRGIFHNGTKR